MPVVRALFISIIVHLLLLLIIALVPPDLSLKQPDVTEVDIISPTAPKTSGKEDKQIVRQAFVPDQLKAQDDATLARFLSEQKQRVKKETRAAQNGLTQNSRGNNPTQPPRDQRMQTQNKAAADNDKKPGQNEKRDLAKEGFQAWTPEGAPSARRGQTGGGPSSVGESLPTDVSIGSFTALNTDRYTYYTFYARIEEMVRFRWESRVQAAIESMDRNTAINLGGKDWNTSAEFLLTPDGHLSSALIMKESGVKKFDAAAIGAFREAAMFPNPPKELVEDDGYIHLKYNFTVSYNPNFIR